MIIQASAIEPYRNPIAWMQEQLNREWEARERVHGRIVMIPEGWAPATIQTVRKWLETYYESYWITENKGTIQYLEIHQTARGKRALKEVAA